MKRTIVMTDGSPMKLILWFMLPIIGINVMQQIYSMADSVIVGQGAGVEALAAVGATDWLRNTVMWAVTGLCEGFGILTAIALGMREECALALYIRNAVIVSAVLGIIISILGIVLATPLLDLIETEASIVDDAASYLRITYGATIFVMLFNLSSSLLKSIGDSKTPFYAIIGSSVINIVLDLIAVYVLHMGVAGVAIATAVAQICCSMYCMSVLLKLPAMREAVSWLPNMRVIVALMMKGMPMALNMTLVAIGGVVLQTVINKAGFDYIAAFAATNKMLLLYEGIAIALGSAMVTYIGQNYGANRFDRIRVGLRCGLVIAIVSSIVLGAVIIMGSKYLMALFIESDCKNFYHIVAIGTLYLKVIAIGLFALYALHVYRQSLMGLGNTFWPFLSGVGEFIGRVGTAFMLVKIIGFNALCAAEVVAFVCADIFLIVPYYIIFNSRIKKYNIRKNITYNV